MEDEYLNALSDIDETLADYSETNKKTSEAVDDFSSTMTTDNPDTEEDLEDEIDEISQQNVIKSEQSNEEILNQLSDLISVSSNTENLQEEEIDLQEEYYEELISQLKQLNTAVAMSAEAESETPEITELNDSISNLVENNSETNNEFIDQFAESTEEDENVIETQMYLNQLDSVTRDTANENEIIEHETAPDIITNNNASNSDIATDIVADEVITQDNTVEHVNDIVTSENKIVLDDDDYDEDDDESYETFSLGDVQQLGKSNVELETMSESLSTEEIVEPTKKTKLPSLMSRVSEEDEMAMLFKSMKSKDKEEDAIIDTDEAMAESFEIMQEDSINETQISNKLSTQQAERLNNILEETAIEPEDLNNAAISEEQIVDDKEEIATIIEKEIVPEIIKTEEVSPTKAEIPTEPEIVKVKEDTDSDKQQNVNNINTTESNVTQQNTNFDKMEELLTNLLHLNAKMLDIQIKSANLKSIHKLKNGPISN